MLGLGEAPADVEATLRDLREVGCDVVTFGQYLRPSKRHMPMREYITPEAFEEWQRVAEVSRSTAPEPVSVLNDWHSELGGRFLSAAETVHSGELRCECNPGFCRA